MRLQTRINVAVVAVLAFVFVAVLGPAPHWTETSSQSCHNCGNFRFLTHSFRWWRLAGTDEQFRQEFPIAPAHVHDWWEFSHGFQSWSAQGASSRGSRYRDGRNIWSP
jgi:hypothetical protein